MSTLAVVNSFEETIDLCSGLEAGGERSAVDQVQFEGAEEAFHCGVVS